MHITVAPIKLIIWQYTKLFVCAGEMSLRLKCNKLDPSFPLGCTSKLLILRFTGLPGDSLPAAAVPLRPPAVCIFPKTCHVVLVITAYRAPSYVHETRWKQVVFELERSGVETYMWHVHVYEQIFLKLVRSCTCVFMNQS